LFQKYSEAVLKAQTVLLIGGGLVGIELAGELCDAYPDKKIIIAESHHVIAGRMNLKARSYFSQYLSKKGVTILTNTKIIGKTENSFSTEDGRKIHADVAFMCTGIRPNSSYIKLPVLDEKGYVRVRNTLQLEGCANIFAAGDVNTVFEEKTAQNAEDQAAIVVKNMYALENHKQLVSYRAHERIMVTSLGPHDGVITYKDCALHGFFASFVKRWIEKYILRKYR
jgi:NADH dehydrogenase FAD-containing subunit